jgi:hypothetical protein
MWCRPLIGIRTQIKELGQPQARKGLRPELHRAVAALLHENDLPVVIAQAEDVAVVTQIDEELARALLHFFSKVPDVQGVQSLRFVQPLCSVQFPSFILPAAWGKEVGDPNLAPFASLRETSLRNSSPAKTPSTQRPRHPTVFSWQPLF